MQAGTIVAETLEAPAPSEADSARPDTAKRRQIMDGARAVFLAAGFDGASMNDVARAAGVSKGTLYAYFESKEALFEAIIREMRSEQAERQWAMPAELGDPRAALFDFGVRLVEKMSEPDTLALARVVIAATPKFPQLGRAFFEAGPLYGATKMTAVLGALVAAGKLELPDPERAAWHFMDLCQSWGYKRLLFAMVEDLGRDEIEAAVAAGVDLFLAAYGAKGA